MEVLRVLLLLLLMLRRFEAVEEKLDLQLAEKLIGDNCRTAANRTAFYLQIREMQGMARRFPTWPNEDTGLAGLQLFWTTTDSLTDILPSYDTFWIDAFTARNITADSYKWCIYLFGENNEDIHGCIQGGRSWGTPMFQSLQLLNKLSLRDAGPVFGLDFPLMVLTISPIKIYGMSDSNLIWNNAMLTLNINWNDPTGSLSPVGEYFILQVHVETPQYMYISDISRQEDSFLIEGAINQLVCEIYGIYYIHHSGWKLEGSELPLFHATDQLCDVENRNPPCPDIYYYKYYFTTDNCKRGTDVIFIGTIRVLMEFRNASRDDTGQYACVIDERNLRKDLQTRSVFVYVVFTEMFQPSLDYKQPGELRCAAKAPVGSRMSVWYNGQQLVQSSDPQHTCDSTPRISVLSEKLDTNFSMFYAVVKICLVSSENIGTYVCQVEYAIPTTSDPQFARTEAEVTVTDSDAEKLSTGQKKTETVAVACSAVFLALVILIFIITVIKVLHYRANRKRSRHHMTFKISPINTFNHQKIPSISVSPGVSLTCMEFSRANLELHKQIGKGRFGKVMLATARNIVPHLPTLNKVAVKMAVTKNSDEIILNELNLMKKLSPHDNICNLLAYCTIDGPVLIILEYAEHGNLKDYLDTCRQNLRQSGRAPFISSDSVMSCSDPFGAGLGGKGSPGSQEKSASFITESQVRNYAFQIACGLEHLEKMEIVHCDLAARNILISEDAVLKIADFGMARSATDTQDTTSGNYIEIDLDSLVAIKWAALEVLQNKGHFFKSDVWSFAVIIWEIASYGARPFSEHKVGVSLSKFIGLLQAGQRLPQPEGLSDSLYQTLLSCWFVDLNTRPSACDLKDYFGSE